MQVNLESHKFAVNRSPVVGSEELPGVTRVSFPYFWDDKTVDYVIKAVIFVARNAARLQKLYRFD